MKPFDLSVFAAPLRVPELEEGPIRLRPFLPSDLSLIRQAASDPYIPAISSVPSSYSDEEGRAFIARQHHSATQGHGYSFAISETGDPRLGIGGLGLWLHEIESGRATIGYWLIPSARGRGLAGWALRGAVGFASEVLSIPRLHLFIEPWNIASQRTAEFAGFTREALLVGWERINGIQRDVYSYSLLREKQMADATSELTDAQA